jgi:ABC-2 type transport system permease protein
MMDFVLGSSRLAFLWLLLISVGSVVLGIFLMATTLDKQNSAIKRRRVNVTRQRNRRPLTCVFLKELKFYFTLPILMINTLLWPILMLALVAWIGIDGGASITNVITTIGLPRDAAVFGITVALTFLAALVCVSCTSISLEGKNFWILKTMPIKPRDVFFGKAFLNIALVAPVVVVSSIVLLFVMELKTLEFLLVLMLPLLANIFSSFGGVYINLIYPRFDWESEEAVVKRSMSVLITMLLGFAIGLVPVAMAFAMGFSNMNALWLVWAGIICVMAVGSVVLTLTKGVALYEKF